MLGSSSSSGHHHYHHQYWRDDKSEQYTAVMHHSAALHRSAGLVSVEKYQPANLRGNIDTQNIITNTPFTQQEVYLVAEFEFEFLLK